MIMIMIINDNDNDNQDTEVIIMVIMAPFVLVLFLGKVEEFFSHRIEYLGGWDSGRFWAGGSIMSP